ncbi:Endocytosis and vacuole integrity protein [Blomia tropicalis]|nr:Endocytosis and vacuole integrity protein [Blomia tropicalis]
MSGDGKISSSEKRLLDDILQHYNLLANEAKKKYPHIKEACETGIIRVRNASSDRILSSIGFRASMNAESLQILEPFFMGCDTKVSKMVQISINAMQKLIIFECLDKVSCQNLLICLWNLMENGIEEVKILQTITLLITTNQLVTNGQLAKTISLCFRLHYTKNSTTNNTASATIRQMVTVVFERVQNEDKKQNINVDVKPELNSKLFDSVSNGDSCQFKPTNLNVFALDAFNFLQDLIQLINGEEPFWLTTGDNHQSIVGITKSFGLELLELIIDQFADIFHKHPEFSFLLKEKVCQLIIKLFSPNIKQRGSQFSFLSPLLPKQMNNSTYNSPTTTNSSLNGNHHQMSNSSAISTTPVQLAQTSFWPITVRLMRIVSVLIRNFFEVLVTESEIFLSFLVKSLEVDKPNWQRSIALESLYRMIQPKLISSLCKCYDMKPHSSKILRDIVNALCIYIQSQFQVVDSSTTASLLTSLVNNTNSGNPSQGFIANNVNNGGGAANQTVSAKNSTFPIFNLRGISISLLFIPSHKVHKYRTFYIEQLEKLEPPTAPEGHGLSTALACILEIVSALTKIIEQDLGQPIESQPLRNKNVTSDSYLSSLPQELRDLHESMLNSTFCGFTGTFSLLLDASTDEVITELILEQMRKLIFLYGLYKIKISRDSLIISMSKSSLPGSYYKIPALNPYNLDFDASFMPKPGNDSLTNSGSLSLSSLSHHSISNGVINLPNLLLQQNVSPQQNQFNSNPNNPTVPSNITSMDNPGNATNFQTDFSRQIIAVGTPMPTITSTASNNSSNSQGPVMLTSKNLQCMNAILAVSNCHGFVYDEQTWHIFAVVKLLETGLVNLSRINLIWNLVTLHLIEVSSHPYNKLREWGVDVLCNLVKSILARPIEEELEKVESDRTVTDQSYYSQSFYLSSLQTLSQIKFVDIRQKQIECCLQLLQSNGENFTDCWPTLFAIIESECGLQNETLVRCAFQCYQFIISDLLPHIPPTYLVGCINTAVAFGSQLQELNVSLTAIGLIWNIADFLHSNQEKIQFSLDENVKNEQLQKTLKIDNLPFAEDLNSFQCLWISLFKCLSNLCTDARLSIRKSSGQTLFSTLSSHGLILDLIPWKTIFFYVLFPLMDCVRTLCSVASNERITHSENSINKPGVDGNSEYIIHYSRNTAFKQWCETQVLVLNGICRIICLKLDLFLQSSATQMNDNENMLINIWSMFFDFLYTSAISTNSEVSISALKSFNEVVHFLNEYQKNKVESTEEVSKSLNPIWKIVWKTWCNIGHNIGPNKIPMTNSDVIKMNGTVNDEIGENMESQSVPQTPTQVLQQLPSQTFLCLLTKPLLYLFPNISNTFTDSDFKSLSFVLQNAISTPFINDPSVYNYGPSDQMLTQLQLDVMNVLEKIQEQIMSNFSVLNHLLSLLFYQYLALSLYAVNIIPPHLNIFISSQFQHRFLPGELTSFNTASFYIFGERALKNAFNMYQSTYKEPTVIKCHILHSLIKAYKIPLCFKYSCPLQSTWKYTVNYFNKTLELGLPLARKHPNDFISIWADLALTFEGFLFPMNKPTTVQTLEEQQTDESLDVKVVEIIRDNIMVYAQQIPKEFLLQIVSILNRGSIHSPSITSPIESDGSRKLREDFARVCFQTLLQFSFFGPKGNPDLFIQPNKPSSPEHSIGIVNKLAVASILKRFNDVIVKYVEDEQLCPCPLPRHRLSEISFVLKALATLIISLKEAPSGSVEMSVWRQLIDLYPKIIDCTMSNSPQVNKSIREVLHEYAYLLKCPTPKAVNSNKSSTSSTSSSASSSSTSGESNNSTSTNGQTNSKMIKTAVPKLGSTNFVVG